jgi:Holliday junction DNA helicase RuvA
MIGWLQGRHMECWTQGNRSGVLLVCAGVGYEVQLTSRHQKQLQPDSELILWIHQVQREDGSSLFGFPSRQERDLFRLLIGVNGVGPQAGLALLHECKPQELVAAISGGDLKRLCQAQGIGKRTAERLAVDLRTPIAAFGGLDPQPSLVEGLASDQIPEAGEDVDPRSSAWATTNSKFVEPYEPSPMEPVVCRHPATIKTVGCGVVCNG